MEDRKRRIPSPASDSGSAAQKRKLSILSSPAGNVANSIQSKEDDESGEPDGSLDASLGLEEGFLDTFRKGAIFRQMQEWKREYKRISAIAEKLDGDWKASQSRLHEIESCWSLLLDDLKTALGDTNANDSHVNGHSDSAYSQRLQEARLLIAAISRHSARPESDFSKRYDTLSAQLIESKSSHDLLQDVLKQTQEELTSTLELLKLSERKFDRNNSATVLKIEKRAEDTSGKSSKRDIKPKNETSSAANAAARPATPNATTDSSLAKIKQEEDGHDQQEGSSGLTRSEIEHLQHLAQSRLQETESLRSDKIALQNELDDLKLSQNSLSEKAVSENVYFRNLQDSFDKLQSSYGELQDKNDALTTECAKLQEAISSLRIDLEKELREQNEELKKKLTFSVNELARIRNHRDAVHNELDRLKSRDDERWRSVDQLTTLAESRQNRIISLASEVQRLRLKLAAASGDAELLALRTETAVSEPESNDDSDPSKPLPEEALVTSLRQKVKENGAFLVNYRNQLATISGLTSTDDNDDLDMAEHLMKSEATAKAELEQIQARYRTLEELIDGAGNGDGAHLRAKYTEAMETIKKLETQLKEQSLSTEMLISEVTRLSEAWAALDQQNSSKILDLKNLELKYEKIAGDRMKAHGRFFTSEREKEAIQVQLNGYIRLSASQTASIEKIQEDKAALFTTIKAVEAQLEEANSKSKIYSEKVLQLEKEISRAVSDKERLTAIEDKSQQVIREKNKLLEAEQAEKKRQEERLARLEKDIEKWKGRAQAGSNGQRKTADSAEYQDLKQYSDNLEKALKCNSCSIRFKTHTITRCYHVFCKECIDARLETRQRKCPNCSIGFGQADVQQIYLQ